MRHSQPMEMPELKLKTRGQFLRLPHTLQIVEANSIPMVDKLTLRTFTQGEPNNLTLVIL